MDQELYSEMVLDLYKHPSNFGELENADIRAEGGNPVCGDEVVLTMLVKDGKIADIKFKGEGCAISRASESLLTELVKGKRLKEVKEMKAQELFDVLGNIVETRIKCALLGLNVLKKGVESFERNRGQKTIITGINI